MWVFPLWKVVVIGAIAVVVSYTIWQRYQRSSHQGRVAARKTIPVSSCNPEMKDASDQIPTQVLVRRVESSPTAKLAYIFRAPSTTRNTD